MNQVHNCEFCEAERYYIYMYYVKDEILVCFLFFLLSLLLTLTIITSFVDF